MKQRVFVAGHRGMVGSAIVRKLESLNDFDVIARRRAELDLVDQQAVAAFFRSERPELVVLAAAKVGGIHANNVYPAEFIYENLMMEANVIKAAHEAGVKRLLFLGSSCIYPKLAEQPMTEASLLTGKLEATNEPYAIAKIAGIKLCESFNRQYGCDFRSVMPTNLYGPNDNFHPENSHVIPALMRRILEAKLNQDASVTIWGSGQPKREFLHVDDMAEASVHVLLLDKARLDEYVEPMSSHINIGTGVDCSIRELSETLCEVIGYEGALEFDASKPDGTPRKLMSVERVKALGWEHKISLKEGLMNTYEWYLKNIESIRQV